MGSCLKDFDYHPTNDKLCIPKCPAEKGFELRMKDGTPACVYTKDPSVYIRLNPTPGIAIGPVSSETLESLTVRINEILDRTREYFKKNPPNDRSYDVEKELDKSYGPIKQWIAEQKAMKDKFNEELAIAYDTIDRPIKIQGAFKKLQDAENVRDEAPESYQQARVQYYTLVKGESWQAGEKERIAKSEVNPSVKKYESGIQELKTRMDQQQKTIDIAKSVQDKVLSLRDEFRYSVNTFGKQMDEVRNQINIRRQTHRDQTTETSMMDWFDIFLNVMLVLVLVAGGYVVYRKMIVTPLQQNVYTPFSLVR